MISLNEQITEYLTYCECRKRLDPKTLKAYRIDLKQYELGLLMDKNGIPLVFNLFPGNVYTHKSRIHPKKIQVNVTVPGQKKKKKKAFPSTRSRWPIIPKNMQKSRNMTTTSWWQGRRI